MVGYYYYDFTDRNFDLTFAHPVKGPHSYTETIEDNAFFGLVAFDFTKDLTLTVEARHMEETKSRREFCSSDSGDYNNWTLSCTNVGPGGTGAPGWYNNALGLRRYDKELSMKSVVGAVEEILSDQLLYRREVPLMTLALAVRETSARASILIEEVVESDELSREEISDIIRACVSRVNERMEGSYVENGKTDPILYDAYFNAIESLLLARYADRDGDGMSLFKCLADVRTKLSLVEYRRIHRAQLEYLFKLSEREFLASARKAL
jgi:hypothetical protein